MAIVVLVISGLRLLVRLVRGAEAEMRFAGIALLVLVVLGVFAAFVGIDHEATIRFNGDERTYVGHAREIDSGNWVRDSFIYPHLLYNLCAAALWVRGLFPGLIDGTIAALWSQRGEEEVVWIFLHGVNACFGLLMVPFAYVFGRRLAGVRAGLMGAALTLASALLIETNHLLLCDVASAFFVLLTLTAVAGLVDQEDRRGYVLAGLAAGLAAGSKWPAGLVAVAIVLVWLVHRLRAWRGGEGRRWSWDLGLAGLVAIGALLASTPSLLVIPELALHGEKDLFFGVRLYANRDWAGIAKESNAGYYGQLLWENFGHLAIALGLVGLLLANRVVRRRVALLAVHPLLLLVLALSMNVAVKRTIHPIVAPFAVLLGVGLAALADRVAARRGRVWALALVSLVLVQPALVATLEVVSFAAPTTRDACVAWIEGNVPRGTRILREHYTPRIPDAWDSEQRRFAVRWSDAELADPRNDYLLVAGPAYSRFLDPALHTKPFHREIQQRYEALFATHELVASFASSRTRRGPLLELYRLRAQETTPRDLPTVLGHLEGWPSTWTMRPQSDGATTFSAAGQDVTFRVVLPAEPLRFAVETGGAVAGSVALVSTAGVVLASGDLDERGTTQLDVPAAEKLLVRVALAAGAELRSLTISRPDGQPAAPNS